MERDIMDIVKEKEFIELTASERVELGDLCSTEDEFNQMKALFAGMSGMSWSNPTPKAETKERLDVLFQQSHPKVAPIWYNSALGVVVPKGKPFYRQPLVQAAAVGLLMFLAYPFVNADVMDSQTNQVAELDEKSTSPEVKEVKAKREKSAAELDDTTTNDHSDLIQSQNKEVTAPAQERLAPVPAPKATALASNVVSFDEIASQPSDGAILPGSDHPDGVFLGDRADIFSVPASRQPEMFDLLTSTF